MAFLIASQVNLDFRIEIERPKFNQASVIIFSNPRASRTNRKWKINIKKIAKTTRPLHKTQMKEYDTQTTGSRTRFDFPLQFEAGSSYRVTVALMECMGWSDGIYQDPDKSVEQTVGFRAGKRGQ